MFQGLPSYTSTSNLKCRSICAQVRLSYYQYIDIAQISKSAVTSKILPRELYLKRSDGTIFCRFSILVKSFTGDQHIWVCQRRKYRANCFVITVIYSLTNTRSLTAFDINIITKHLSKLRTPTTFGRLNTFGFRVRLLLYLSSSAWWPRVF